MASVTSSGGGLNAKLREIQDRLDKAHVTRVGFLENADYPDGGLNVPTVAAINNFGAPEAGIPARPFFTKMVEKNKGDWAEVFGNGLKSLDFDAEKALEIMGEIMAGQVREEIVALQEPANSPVTNLLKQRFPMRDGMTFADVHQAREDVSNGETAPAGKPLVWSGHMLNSVASEVK